MSGPDEPPVVDAQETAADEPVDRPAPEPTLEPAVGTRRRTVAVVLAVAFIVTTIVVGVVGIATTSGGGSDIAGVGVGDCITVTGVTARTDAVDCGADAVNFRVAEHFPADNASCVGGGYARLAQRGEGVLCLVPNLQIGRCYGPSDLGHDLGDFAEVDCATTAPGSGVVAMVSNRADATVIDCRDGVPVTFARPTPRSYCIDARRR